MSKPPRQLDSRIEIVTPENIAFHYVLAGPFRRLPAFLIDVAIRAVVLFAIGLVGTWLFSLAGATGLGWGVTLVSWFALAWFYGGFFETYWNGQTPGKRILGLRVLTVDGQPINALQAVLRNILRDADSMPMAAVGGIGVPLYMLGLAVMAANDRYQRLGDLACGTIVVVEQRSKLRGLASLGQTEIARFAENVPLNFKVNRALGQALSVYVARRELFSAERRFEIARTLAEPLCVLLDLPGDTNPDLLLCALYYRTFIADRPGEFESLADNSRRIEVGTP
ncbi:MAG: RDD family protein [Planctomycetia bacterium]|nr:RDD family protein [Planctomycetia bacterium]